MSSDLHNYGIIGFTSDNVGIDRRIYTGLTSTDPVLNVSYNGGRVDVYLNGIKLVGDHSEMPSGTRDYTFTQTGQGSSIQLRTGVALVSADVVECIGHVGLGSNTITTYNYTATSNQTAFTANNVSSDLVNVFLNGVLLDSSDYNLNTSDTVTLSSGASVSDIVHIQVIGALDNSNFVPVGGGTFTGTVAHTGTLNVSGGTFTTSPAQKQAISATAFASGTRMMFQQETAPTGWTKETSSFNDYMLRLTTGTPANYTSGNGVSGNVGNTTLSTSQTPYMEVVHRQDGGTPNYSTIYASGTTFGVCSSGFGISTFTGGVNTSGSCSYYNRIVVNNGGGSHTHDLNINYVDIIIAQKD